MVGVFAKCCLEVGAVGMCCRVVGVDEVLAVDAGVEKFQPSRNFTFNYSSVIYISLSDEQR